ncbi:MAG: polysaccharide biosynthesis protein, partial [Dehalococcoidia bacterium]
MFKISRYHIPQFLIDIVLVAAAFALAFLFRFDFSIPSAQFELLQTLILPVLAAKIIIFFFTGLYRRMWRYASVRDFYTV